MEIHQLRYAAAVARTGNFSRAAEQCHVSQPSLSQQIQKLEDELGERLFDRLKRTARLTPHGEVFIQRAIRILDEVEAARRDASDAHELLRGTLTFGILPTIAPYLLPDTIAAFTAQFPGVELVIQEDTTAVLLKRVLSCEVDFAIVSLPLNENRIEIRELYAEELLLALPPDHALAEKRSVKPDDLDGEPLIVMKEGHCLGGQVLQFCHRHEAGPRISFRSAQLETIQALVHSGMGISLVPAMAAHPERKNAPVYRPFTTPKPKRVIVAVWPKNRGLGKAPNAFLKQLAVSISPKVTAKN